MKKLFGVLAFAGMAALVACGPSAEELEKAAKRLADSLDSVAKADSIKAQKEADSLAALGAADTTKPEEKKEEVKK